jgi:hypothetical protein
MCDPPARSGQRATDKMRSWNWLAFEGGVLGDLVVSDSGARPRLDMADGTVTAEADIITLPSALLAEETLTLSPPLPEKIAAAAGLPLGLADKLFLSLSDAAEFDKEDSRYHSRRWPHRIRTRER